MAPVAVENQTPLAPSVADLKAHLSTETLRSASPSDLRAFAHADNTPPIGTEFFGVETNGAPPLTIREVLVSPAHLKALSTLVAERGVVFFRNSPITPEEQKELVQALGVASGKPATSGLHTHPITLPGTEYGDKISHISNQFVLSPLFKFNQQQQYAPDKPGKDGWHTDITFERVPSDYASLVIRKIPESGGGDTLWASAYAAYDKLSPALQSFLEGLTATHRGDIFLQLQKATGAALRERRGAPENTDLALETSHPVIRTNPVTGWKGLFVNKGFTRKINELTGPESDLLLEYLFDIVPANHDIQVRFKWQPDSIAIWDNRSTFHNATGDLDRETDVREGTRSVSLGEIPFFDPNSKSRKQDLAERKAAAKAAAEAK